MEVEISDAHSTVTFCPYHVIPRNVSLHPLDKVVCLRLEFHNRVRRDGSTLDEVIEASVEDPLEQLCAFVVR